LLRLAYAGIKDARPGMPVVAGGYGNLQSSTSAGIPMESFVRSVYRAGARGHQDAIGFHPYPIGPTDGILDASFAQIRKARRDFGDEDTPLWATEIGLTTTGTVGRVTEQQQGDGLVRLYDKLRAMSDVEAIFVHSLVESGGSVLFPTDVPGFGVLRARTLAPKVAYCKLGLRVSGRWPC
jgi:hypothetical protein